MRPWLSHSNMREPVCAPCARPERDVPPGGILNEHWRRSGGGDGFLVLADTVDGRSLYAASQYLGLTRLDRRTLSIVKRGFVVRGDDRVGAVRRHFDRLAAAGINAVANSAVGAGKGRYGMILRVRPKDYARAARALGAR